MQRYTDVTSPCLWCVIKLLIHTTEGSPECVCACILYYNQKASHACVEICGGVKGYNVKVRQVAQVLKHRLGTLGHNYTLYTPVSHCDSCTHGTQFTLFVSFFSLLKLYHHLCTNKIKREVTVCLKGMTKAQLAVCTPMLRLSLLLVLLYRLFKIPTVSTSIVVNTFLLLKSQNALQQVSVKTMNPGFRVAQQSWSVFRILMMPSVARSQGANLAVLSSHSAFVVLWHVLSESFFPGL